jgi:hypothetical protein
MYLLINIFFPLLPIEKDNKSAETKPITETKNTIGILKTPVAAAKDAV